MLSRVPLALGLIWCVEARTNQNPYGLRFDRRLAVNETASIYTNTTTTITTPTTASSTTSTSSATQSINSISSSSSTTSQTQLKPPPSNGTTAQPDCAGFVTYWGSVPPTVYITVTEGVEVTVPSSNATVTAAESLLTPPPACDSTILPLLGSFQPLQTIDITSQISVKGPPSNGTGLPHPQASTALGEPPKVSHAPQPENGETHTEQASLVFTTIKSTIYATAPYTSTVVVTKKTTVVVVATPTSAPPVFQNPSPNEDNDPGPQRPGGPNPSPTSQPANDSPRPSNGPSNDNPPNNSPSRPAPSPGPVIVVPGPSATTTAGVGGVIVSLIRTQPFAPIPATPSTTIGNVPVVVLPSSVIIGSSAIAIPASSEAIATVEGQVFTIRPSEIVAADTTLPLRAGAVPATSTFSTDITVAPGFVAQVAGSTVVIDGSTFRIGDGATPTTITVGGVPVGIGPAGLTLPSTTVAANALTAAPKVVESVDGLVFSIDASEVVVDGTTFSIGSGAPTILTEIDGQSVSIGLGGVGLQSTTLQPTSINTSRPSMTGTGAGTAATNSVAQGDDAVRIGKLLSIKELLGWTLMVIAGGLF